MTLARTLTTAVLAAGLTAAAMGDADARRRGGRSHNAVSEQRLKLNSEWRRAHAVGGYADPLSSLFSVLASDGAEAMPRARGVAPSMQTDRWELVD